MAAEFRRTGDNWIRTDRTDRTYQTRVLHPEDLSPRLTPTVTQGLSNLVPEKCLGCAEGVWHSERYHFAQLSTPLTTVRADQLRLINARNNADPWPNGAASKEEIIETLDVRIVAVRAADGTWAAYWKPLTNDGFGHLVAPADASIASGGHKLGADAARFSFFTQIVGDYRK